MEPDKVYLGSKNTPDALYAYDESSETWYRIYMWVYAGDGTPVTKAKEEVSKSQVSFKFRNSVLGRDIRRCQSHPNTDQDTIATAMTDAEQPTDGTEHFVSVRSVQVWSGGINTDMVDDDGNLRDNANDLEFQEERSLSFECECGERFRKWETAADHLRSVNTDTENEVGR